MSALVKTAITVSVVGTGGIIYAQLRQMEKMANSPFFKEAFKLVRAHPGTVPENVIICIRFTLFNCLVFQFFFLC